jgi:dTDP-4-dehydrorhamnose reductase
VRVKKVYNAPWHTCAHHNNNMKILLLGKNGQVGWELQRTLAPLGEITALGRSELDLADQNAIRHAVRTTKPDLIVNAAAYTAVDKAESEPELAMAINGIAPGILAEEAALANAYLVHYSTDYVFDGTQKTPYAELDSPNPVNIYGKTKLAGEEAITNTGCRHLILRTSWVYSLRGSNFLLTILRLAAERNELSIVNDQHGAPTWARMIAEATTLIIATARAYKSAEGIYHLTATGETTWHGFATAIINQATARGLLATKPALKAISSADYPTAAQRPKNSLLDCSALHCTYDLKLPDWATSLDLALDEQKVVFD